MRHLIPALLGALAPLAAGAAEPLPDERADYDRCIALVAEAPGEALIVAEDWTGRGGGPAAEHCAAMALAADGALEIAARRLSDLAATAKAVPAAVRAEMLGQAAGFWLEAGRGAEAREAAEAALRLDPQAAALHLLAAEIDAAAGRWSAAEGRLDRALALRPEDAELLTLRAAARRQGGDPRGARADAARAAALSPGSALARFELGAAEAALGEPGAAREAWLAAIAAEPDSPAAAQARLSLQALDAP